MKPGVVLMIGLAGAGLAMAEEGWSTYRSDDYGFSMLIPEGTTMAEKESSGGWGQLYAESDGVQVYAVAKMGEQAKPEEIEKFGMKLTGIGSASWKVIDKGENSGGWNWYRTVECSEGGKLIFGGYGTGKKGSYLILLETTEADYQAHKADYRTWYESIELH